MTLSDLYKMLDWSDADKSLAGWNEKHGADHIGMEFEEVRYRRCLVINGALLGESPEIRRFCIGSLMGAGVWDQIESVLGRKDGKDLREADTEPSSEVVEEDD